VAPQLSEGIVEVAIYCSISICFRSKVDIAHLQIYKMMRVLHKMLEQCLSGCGCIRDLLHYSCYYNKVPGAQPLNSLFTNFCQGLQLFLSTYPFVIHKSVKDYTGMDTR
jgi:hypothetical protein